jgi:PIN domain nuclease of toxin-antitoxin system
MATVIHLDTHVVVWLYQRDLKRLAPIQQRIDGKELVISPMVLLELAHLFEIGRVGVPGEEVVAFMRAEYGLRVSDQPFLAVVQASLAQTWTRDPFDRIIAAQALLEGAPLLTADRLLREHCPVAVWD